MSLSRRVYAVRILFELLQYWMNAVLWMHSLIYARVVFEHWPLDLTQMNNRLASMLCL